VLAIERRAQYKCHRPETALLYQLVERYYADSTAKLAEQGKYLHKYESIEFNKYR
jgi:hypothetical protein